MELLRSRILGEGQPVIILHGFLGMSDNWKSIGSRYAENGHQVHLVDQRNHGRSFWSKEFNYSLLADDLERYLDEHVKGEVIILGHSMGGKTAMQFACTRPERVEKLLLADIAPKYYPPHHQQIIGGLNAVPRDTIESRVQADEVLAEHITDMGIRQFLLKNLYWVDRNRLDFRFNLDVLQFASETVGTALDPDALFDKPTLFLKGELSDYIIEEDLELINSHFPLARLVIIQRAGHWLHSENPDQFVTESLEFMNS
ncbi:MAG: alpha/beta fold hydrolase [Flavobacteriaceae bacterium]